MEPPCAPTSVAMRDQDATIPARRADDENARIPQIDSFAGSKAGDERDVARVKLCWCPPGRFQMGSPRGETERRLDERQVEVTLTRGIWMGKFEMTQGQWKKV